MKTYSYNPSRYFWAVTAPGILMIVALVYGIVISFQNPGFNIYGLIAFIAVYGINNTFISISYPKKIIDDGEKIEFYAFGRSHSYYWKEIKSLRIKEFYGGKLYLRVGNSNAFKGRYWVKTSMFNDGIDLYNKFKDAEKRLHPDLLKFQQRPSNTNISKKKKKK
ncbi:hypothetical protein KQI42_13860 [Tissierella sp. MSJ-40]|uniref:Uncharacterized protein n=1 Tax=Tissierella simiarum TaxID=2841534 RepID=A0ABS6EA80_9FIRM|nr:hypothetical protein [Tissierella simiarum]MBU5439104.1 hypothetical protein [Tissierella simiarum]